jgi:hypothetical protein
MPACDQSRNPLGRSIRFTSSPVNGAYFARQVQKSSANFSRGSMADAEHPTEAMKKSKPGKALFTTEVSSGSPVPKRKILSPHGTR